MRIPMLLLSSILILIAAAPATRPFAPTSDYTPKTIQGWKVLISNDLQENDPVTSSACLALLDHKLFEVTRVIPARALEKLRQVTIWLDRDNPLTPGGAYHPSRQWLVEHGMNPEKAKCVEFGHAKNFLTWSLDQPALVIHELSHAYHDQVLGFDHPEIRAAYQKAKAGKTYDAVLRINGRVEKAYAMNDEKEYFAELSEAYFGTNDFYPFVRSEVKKHDPEMFEVLKRVWGR